MCESLFASPGPSPLVVMVGDTVRESSRIGELLAAGSVIVLAPNLEAGRRWLSTALDGEPEAMRQRAVVRLDHLEIDLTAQRARWIDAALDLTKQEFQILTALAEDPGRAWTFADLALRVWGGVFQGDAAVRSAIKRLRKKLRRAGAEIAIQSIRGVGFRLTPNPAMRWKGVEADAPSVN
jgi:two-component system, OmpR family, response regulator MtrA